MIYIKPEGAQSAAQWRPLSQADDITLAQEAGRIFNDYYNATLPQFERYRKNDIFYRGEHWSLVPTEEENEPRPHTPVLWSTCDNVHADLVEACPGATIEAQTVADFGKARNVTGLFKSLLRRIGFRRTWSDMTAALVRQGTDVLEVFWDKSLYGGLGDVNMQRWSIRQFLFDNCAADLNESPAVIKYRYERADNLKARYPQVADRIGNLGVSAGVSDSIAADGMALVYDFWWRELEPTEGNRESDRYSIYWCKVAGGVVVARSQQAGGTKSVYGHGRYPFVVIPYDGIEGSLYGLGIVDRFKQAQWLIDLCDQMALKNLIVSARNKLLVNENAGIDMDALRDWRTDIIGGKDISENAVRWFDKQPFAAAQLQFSQYKTTQMKDESGQNDFVRGEGGQGITAASAIKALQDAGSKRARKRIEAIYSYCEEAFRLCLLLMCEFYTEKRQYSLSFEGEMVEQDISRADFLTGDSGRMLDFDLSIHAEKGMGYNTLYNNQQAIEMGKLGLLPPDIVLEMMDFNRKEEILAKLRVAKPSRNDEGVVPTRAEFHPPFV